MALKKYLGPECNLAGIGPVKTGQIVALTDEQVGGFMKHAPAEIRDLTPAEAKAEAERSAREADAERRAATKVATKAVAKPADAAESADTGGGTPPEGDKPTA